MRRILLLLLLGSVLIGAGLSAARAAAEPAPLIVAYGNGVHAYFGGDYQSSYDALSGVIEAGSNDPRAYYFRGLSALKLGRLDEAEADFQQGANLEAEGRGGVGGRTIGRALERVQGCDRLNLEIAGGGTHPGGGVPLVMLSGRFAAGLAEAHLGGAR